jgi:hypothetical protein
MFLTEYPLIEKIVTLPLLCIPFLKTRQTQTRINIPRKLLCFNVSVSLTTLKRMAQGSDGIAGARS